MTLVVVRVSCVATEGTVLSRVSDNSPVALTQTAYCNSSTKRFPKN